MEDAHISDLAQGNNSNIHIFGVFDGHGGKKNIKKVLIYPKKSKAMNLAFDVTPAKYVTGLITEKGICEASSDALKKMFK